MFEYQDTLLYYIYFKSSNLTNNIINLRTDIGWFRTKMLPNWRFTVEISTMSSFGGNLASVTFKNNFIASLIYTLVILSTISLFFLGIMFTAQ